MVCWRILNRLILGGMALALIYPMESRADDKEGDEKAWRSSIGSVHAQFKGQKGTFAHFGDSITDTRAFWTPLRNGRKNTSPEMEKAFQLVDRHLRPACWREWKGPAFGNQSGQTIDWADKNVSTWLKNLDPEVALIMFGTNDLTNVSTDDYQRKLRDVARKCLANGTVPILSTIPPRHGLVEKSASFAKAARDVARELKVPLVDYHAEILKRRPNDWDGATDQFRDFEGYDVPTLLSRDGVHPSNPKKYQDDYSEEALRSHGYGLRNYLVLMKYAEVLEAFSMP